MAQERIAPHCAPRLSIFGIHPDTFKEQAHMFYAADVFVGVVGASQTTSFMMEDGGECPVGPSPSALALFPQMCRCFFVEGRSLGAPEQRIRGLSTSNAWGWV